ncbi:uncharacterized protein LOC143318997 [Chaetodon auriga]|uniref:uncharacterized protein LOC143318997 n=1 Tax=Chaetodon auriga TaxID=39042 RepID=UPI0040329A05
MDQQLDISANGDGQSHNHRKWTRESKSSEHIYDEINNLEPNRTGPALSDVKKSSYRAAAVFLGLLCLLLLAGLITLFILYNNLTKDRHRLLTSYNKLTTELDQLQTSYNDMAKERDHFQKRFEDMAKERNDLKGKLQDQTNQQQWVVFNGNSYYISSLKKSWQESRDDCLQRGADLVIINSKEEHEFTRHFKRLMWIGLTDRDTEGTWKWVDGTPLTTSYWAHHEPNGVPHRDEDCAEIKMYNSENSWNDESCGLQRFWICEKKWTR